MRILFVNLSALRFTAATPDHEPLGGSETSLCHLARALARRGHQVAIAANLPVATPECVEDIVHHPLARITEQAFFAAGAFDRIILCNAPAAAPSFKMLAPSARIILWTHILPDQASMQALAQDQVRQSIDATVFVSHWQRHQVERAFGLLPDAQVIGNGIAPAFENMFASPEDLRAAKQNRAIYASTPYRGLEVLIRAMEQFDRSTPLDIFSSMRVYQTADQDYAALFDRAARNPRLIRHGSVPQKMLAQHCRRAAFLFYPSIYPETFCIVAAEAMAAGMAVVTTRLGALEETTMEFATLVPIASQDGDRLVADFSAAMRDTVDHFTAAPDLWAQAMFAQSQRANAAFGWAVRAAAWESLLKN